ncbi:superfamily I DNA/RNA helicase [Streptomyces nodosus]|nr:3'-5' exonuclease [Streptomyces nodosus]MBB4790412.1 superfamily I DNA/RNA helicase [Streptomyces nodosus]
MARWDSSSGHVPLGAQRFSAAAEKRAAPEVVPPELAEELVQVVRLFRKDDRLVRVAAPDDRGLDETGVDLPHGSETGDAAEEKLRAGGIPVLRVKGQVAQRPEGIRLATMHAMKGLEFRAVSVLGAGEGTIPFAREITPREADPLQHHADLLRERCLLFVACTRAREALSVTWSGTPSPFLPDPA